MWTPQPLIKGFRATTYIKAFLLNAISIALIAVVAYESHNLLDKHVKKLNEPSKVAISFASAFVTALIVFTILYFLFGFGGGMLATPN